MLGGCEVLIDVFGKFELFLFNHVHEFNACDCSCCGVNFPETSHRRCDPLDVTVILFNDIVEIFGLAENEITFASEHRRFVKML